jgi:hypothetical protein
VHSGSIEELIKALIVGLIFGLIAGLIVGLAAAQWEKVVLWNVRSGSARGQCLSGLSHNVRKLAFGQIAGEPIIVSGDPNQKRRCRQVAFQKAAFA